MRTTETQQAALHLVMCLEIIDKFVSLWEMASDEDRQGMAHQLFEYIVVDLDTKRITDFRLKSWADQFLVLREALYRREADSSGNGLGELDNEEANKNGASSDAPFYAPMGLWRRETVHMLPSVEETVRGLVYRLHVTFPGSSPRRRSTAERDDIIREKYAGGLSIPKLAREYRLSRARIHQILHRRYR